MAEARFTSGSTMRHVAVMTATGGVGLMALFMVDAINLFYIALLGAQELAAAIGFAGTLQFFLIAVSIGLSIAATAVVSRSVGAGEEAVARRQAGTALVVLVSVLTLVAIGVFVWRREALALLGASGETLDLATRFMAIVLPSLPFLGVAMVTSGLLRAVGDARRAMNVTLLGGFIAALLDPLFIFGFGLGLDGAAIVTVLSRITIAGIGVYFCTRAHDLIGPPGGLGGGSLGALATDARALLAIAGPAVATQLSTPFGNAYLTRLVAEHGDDAVAGWAVVGRIGAVAFGGLFALSGAIGPILGQNLGAGLGARIRMAYRDALIFVLVYVGVVWVAMLLATDWLAQAFGLQGAGIEVLSAFTLYGTAAWLFHGSLFVSNAAFNNLGRPLWATGFNWSRDAAVIPLLAVVLAGVVGAADAVAVQAASGLIVGLAAVVAGARRVARLDRAMTPEPAPSADLAPFASGRAALGSALGSRLER